MHNDASGFVSSPWMGTIPHFALFLVLASLLILLVIRFGGWMFATSKVKATKQQPLQPISQKQWAANLEEPNAPVKRKSPLAPELLSDGVIRFLEEAEARRYQLKSDGRKTH